MPLRILTTTMQRSVSWRRRLTWPAQVNIGLKANQADLVVTNAAVATKASQADLNTTNAAIATKAAQADMLTVETTLGEVETFANNANDYFDFPNRLFRDSHTQALIVKNLRVLATNDFQAPRTTHFTPRAPSPTQA